jgi:calpain
LCNCFFCFFSGGIGEQYELKNSPIDIYKILLKAYERCSMLSCSIDPDPKVHEARTASGLVRGHAYSVTKVVLAKIDTGNKSGLFPLVRVRNPWGNEAEWKGPWSDGSREWSYIPEVNHCG